jgi:ATP-dependent RNA helicase DeaD
MTPHAQVDQRKPSQENLGADHGRAEQKRAIPPVKMPRHEPMSKREFPWSAESRRKEQEAVARAPKHSRRTPEQQTRLYMNVGSAMGIKPGDVIGTILGETGLPATIVGTVDIRERHLFVDVNAEHAQAIISRLNRTRMRGNKLKVKLA